MVKRVSIKRILALGIMFCMLCGLQLNVFAAERTGETEPNDTFETAELMQATSHSAADAVKGNASNQHPKNGYTSINDEDWFKVYLNAGEQYVTFNGDRGVTYEIEVYNSNKTLLMSERYTKTGLGGTAFVFNASSSGYHYVKVVGATTVFSDYIIMIGGPIYTVESCTVPLGNIRMSGNDEVFTFDISQEKRIPEDAIVYTMSVSNVRGSDINGVSVRNISTSNRLTLGTYTLDASGLVNLKMPVLSKWEFTFGYKKNLTISPTVNFYYVYPLKSTYAEEDVVIRP